MNNQSKLMALFFCLIVITLFEGVYVSAWSNNTFSYGGNITYDILNDSYFNTNLWNNYSTIVNGDSFNIIETNYLYLLSQAHGNPGGTVTGTIIANNSQGIDFINNGGSNPIINFELNWTSKYIGGYNKILVGLGNSNNQIYNTIFQVSLAQSQSSGRNNYTLFINNIAKSMSLYENGNLQNTVDISSLSSGYLTFRIIADTGANSGQGASASAGIFNLYANNLPYIQLTSENLTFNGNQNITRYLSIPSNTILTNGFLNLSGYNVSTNAFYQVNTPNWWKSVNATNGPNVTNPSYAVDGDWSTEATWQMVVAGDTHKYINYYENFTNNANNIGAILTTKVYFGNSNQQVTVYCWNGTLWENQFSASGSINNQIYTYPINSDCLYTNNLQLNLLFYTGDGFATVNQGYYETNVTYYNSTIIPSYPTNPSLSIGTQGWSYSGIFNQTNNKTNNLANIINNYLSTCTFSNGFCLVPFIFHSDTAGILQYSDLIFNNNGFTENSQTFNSATSSGSYENFKINLTYDSLQNSGIKVILNYNNTNYTTSTTDSGNTKVFSTSLNVPIVNSQTNKSFYYIIGLTNSSGTTYFNSSSNNQSVKIFTIDNCSTNTQKIMNFTMIDEESLNQINGTIEALIQLYSPNSNSPITVYNQTINYLTGVESKICSSNLTSQYNLAYTLKYYGNSSYFKRYKTVQLMALTNITNQLTLYNLLQSSGYPFKIIVTGNIQTSNGNSNLLVDAQRQYLSLNQFNSVESSVTDSNGEAIINLVPQTVVYNFVVSYNGVVLGTFNNYKVQCQNPSTSQCSVILNLGQAVATMPNYQNYGNIQGSYILDSNNSILYFNYNSIDGNTHNIVQNVIENDNYGNTTICQNTGSGTSGTLVCNIPTIYQNTTFYSEVYVDGIYIGTNTFSLGSTPNYYGVDIFIELLLYTTVVILLVGNPILMVIGAILGFSLGLILLFVTGGSISAIIGVVIAFALGGVIIIWKISKRV